MTTIITTGHPKPLENMYAIDGNFIDSYVKFVLKTSYKVDTCFFYSTNKWCLWVKELCKDTYTKIELAH